ncbi:MAG: dockerin type I domain-containing protein [Clostridiales bacterium]|nr:dockerin type I domain-containing protein [Clostridiales bacterium]
MKKRLTIVLVTTLLLVLAFSAIASAEFVKGLEKNKELYPTWIVDEQTQPIFTYANAIREVVYIELPCDTDRDGIRDRVTAWIMRPNAPGFLAPVLLEHSSYHNGTVGWGNVSSLAIPEEMKAPFRYKDNWPIHRDLSLPIYDDSTDLSYEDIRYKGTEAWNWPWDNPDAFTVDSWYTGITPGQVPPATVPTEVGTAPGFPYGTDMFATNPIFSGNASSSPVYYRYYLPRGYALILSQLLGSRDSDGITGCSHIEETLSAMAVAKWLNGEAKAFTTRRGTVEVKADWANGNLAMTGTSYPGILAEAASTSGVVGLKAVMPQCNIANWYDYYRNSGSVSSPGGYGGEDMYLHASYNFSRWRADLAPGGSTTGYIPSPTGTWFPKAIQDVFYSVQNHMMDVQDVATGDYNAEWDIRNLPRNAGKIADDCGVLVINALMDWNTKPKGPFLYWKSLEDNHNGVHKMFVSISGHASQNNILVHGKSMMEWWHLWMDHFLMGLENNVVEDLPQVTIANNRTGEMEAFDTFPVPGAEDQKIYLHPAQEGHAGRLSYYQPPPAVEHFSDLTIEEQILAPLPLGATSRPSTTIPQSTDGNYRATSAQVQYCENRLIGVIRNGTSSEYTNQQILEAIDKPIPGRLMYISEPLTERMRLSGTPVLHLQAAPSLGVGNLTAALVEIGRQRRAQSMTGRASAALSTTSAYTLQIGGGFNGTVGISRYNVPAATGNFLNHTYVTWGYADVQNPNYSGKVWYEVPEQGYTPDFYFQTTRIVPGQYYPYTIEMDTYDYTFEPGMRIGVMIWGTDVDYSLLYDKCCTPEFDVQLGEGSYLSIPLKLAEPEEPVTIEVSSVLAKPGEEVEVSYSIKGNGSGFSALDLKIPYDKSIYEPTGITAVTPAGSLVSPFFVANPFFADGVMRVAFASDGNIAGDGLLFTVKYKVAAGAPTLLDYPLTVEPVKIQYGSLMDKLVDLDIVVEKGALVIGIPGDVNGDGVVSPEDAMLILQMIVGLIEWTPRALLLGDINGDGIVDTTDAALILRMVVGG